MANENARIGDVREGRWSDNWSDRRRRDADSGGQGGRAERPGAIAAPPLSDEIAASALDPAARRDLGGLQKDVAETVARHLVAAGMLVDEDPAAALAHARYARRRASRIAVVREGAGIAAYHAGEWAEALAELRAARRMGGGPGHLAVMADIERAMGRPERAIELARGPEARELPRNAQIELAIVVAGARRDLDELDAAVVALQVPELEASRRDPWSARLFYAYADNLLAAGRESDALQWFVHAADADVDGQTDADVRIADLTGEPLADDGIEFALEEDAEATAHEPAPDGETDDPADRESDHPVDHIADDAANDLAGDAADLSIGEADDGRADNTVDTTERTDGSVGDAAADEVAEVVDSDASDHAVDHAVDHAADETAAHLAGSPVDHAPVAVADNPAVDAVDVVESDASDDAVDHAVDVADKKSAHLADLPADHVADDVAQAADVVDNDAAEQVVDEAAAHPAARPVDHVAESTGDNAVGNPSEQGADAADHVLGDAADSSAGHDGDAPGLTAPTSGPEDASVAGRAEPVAASPTNGSAPHVAPASSVPPPSDPAPSDPAPSDPAPSDPAPSDPAPSEHALADLASLDPAQVVSEQSDPASSDAAPSDSASSEPATSDPDPVPARSGAEPR